MVLIFNKRCLIFHQILDDVQSKDMGPVGETLSQLMGKLKSVNPNDINPENNLD